MQPDIDHAAAFFGGFVAAEGYFYGSKDKFRFALALGARDRGMCEMGRSVFGVGSVAERTRRQAHFDDESVFVVRRLKELVEVVIPFMDAYLPPSRRA